MLNDVVGTVVKRYKYVGPNRRFSKEKIGINLLPPTDY